MRKKKMKKMFMEIMDERFQDYRGIELWQKVIDNENKIETLRASTEDVLPTLTAIWGHPTFKEYRSK